MEFISLILGLALFIFVCKKLSRFFFRTAAYLDEREQYKRYHEGIIRDALIDMREAVIPKEEDAEDYTQRLVQANKEIIMKKKTREAIANELNIEM